MKGLHPDLVDYIVKGPLGGMLKHPLVVEIFLHPETIERVNKTYKAKRKAFDEAEANLNYNKMFVLYERPFRVELLAEYWDSMDDKQKGEYLSFVYTDSENPSVNNRYWKQWFNEVGMDVMEVNEIDELLALPDKVTIYRGMSKKEKASGTYGISWTLDEEVAKFFAKRFQLKGTVEKRIIDKSEIKALLLGRDEKEVIYYTLTH
jgi:hypothetical protein